MAERAPKRMAYDRWLFFTAALLVFGGLLMVGSSSNYVALDSGRSPSAFWVRHGLHALLGLAGMIGALSVHYQRLDRRGLIGALILITLVALIVVLAMPAAGGARRWLPLGPFKLQPSEFAKLLVVAFLAYLLSRKAARVNAAAVLVPSALVVGSLAVLVLVEPDLGSAAMLVLVAAVMTFVAGLRWKYIGVAAAAGVVLLASAIVIAPYRWERVAGWWNVWTDPSAESRGANFQLDQSLLAIGAGGLVGVGLGQGQQKAFYVPASHTDFIFSVVGEELGLAGTLALLGAYLILFWRGLRAAVRAPDRFGFYLGMGLTCLLVLQALTNMAVCLGLLPTKGLPLPLISYGGSSLLASMIALGTLINISQHSN